jgi:hypothetical protein
MCATFLSLASLASINRIFPGMAHGYASLTGTSLFVVFGVYGGVYVLHALMRAAVARAEEILLCILQYCWGFTEIYYLFYFDEVVYPHISRIFTASRYNEFIVSNSFKFNILSGKFHFSSFFDISVS